MRNRIKKKFTKLHIRIITFFRPSSDKELILVNYNYYFM
jgi:hypothetical protein